MGAQAMVSRDRVPIAGVPAPVHDRVTRTSVDWGPGKISQCQHPETPELARCYWSRRLCDAITAPDGQLSTMSEALTP